MSAHLSLQSNQQHEEKQLNRLFECRTSEPAQRYAILLKGQ